MHFWSIIDLGEIKDTMKKAHMKGIKKMAERKPYTTKTRQIILEYLKSQKAVTVSVADIEKYLKTEEELR